MALAAFSLLVLGYVVAVAARTRPGSSADDPLFDLESGLDIDATRIFAWIIVAMAIMGAVLFVLGLKQSKPQEDKKKRSLLGLFLGVIAFFLIFRYLQPATQALLEAPPPAETGEAVGQPGTEGGGDSSSWLFALLVAAVVAAALARVGMTVRESDTSLEIEPALVGPPIAVSGERRATLAPLGADPRSRVLAAYWRFEDALTECGVPRKANETANRHAGRARRDLGLGRSEVDQLMSRYARTRFGFGSISDEMAQEAEVLSKDLCRVIRR
jgi:hypothetical protein